MSTTSEIDHGQILPLAGIRPAPENKDLYRPVDPDDPDVRALAESIVRHGICEPLVVSSDGFILSGHRRYTAAVLAGLIEVPCRVHPIHRRDDPDRFVELLREFNRQRVKTFDEVVREEIVSADPDEAYEALLEHRAQQSAPADNAMHIGKVKARPVISKAKIPFLNAAIDILNVNRDYWPMSDRQIHYGLLNDPPLMHASKTDSMYSNDKKCYHALTDILTRARLDGTIPFHAIEDATRPVTLWNVHGNVAGFIRHEMDVFLKGYWRDLMQSQPKHIEIIVEKNTAVGIVKKVAAEYTIPVTSTRGYCSLPPRRGVAERYEKSGKDALVLLVLSDHDPDGEEIAQSFVRSMRGDFGIDNVEGIKVALTPEQVRRFGLPPKMQAKKTSSNYTKFQKNHGDDVFELEALRSADLQAVLREAIEGVVDREALNREIAAEKNDAAHLDVLRRRVRDAVGRIVTDDGQQEVPS